MYTGDNRKRPVTVATLARMKRAGEKIACMTAYDYTFAAVTDRAGMDVILVGDSLGMTMQGRETTLPVTMEELIYHARCVAAARPTALLMVDMPFMSHATVDDALRNGARMMKEGSAEMVKLEGGREQVEAVRRLTGAGVPVCAHLGLQPQTVHKLGGYRVQGRDAADAEAMVDDARALAAAGADMILLECVPSAVAARVTAEVAVPVIGIGAGSDTDGQILVLQDVLGITPGQAPRFSRNFMTDADSIQDALAAYVTAVREGGFPLPEHSF